ncbi:SDR family NAD(P)-dependent oxidoreductase [Pararhodobacter oceanensis]|uniref:Oxidoreductase n=1 Tax=Pararhodobacter oceanensis TaxID=2172121 RepID=A0A2T8HYM6_9RHOB|nr:SDR family oxidoreductase [Pararhodobacter oceanensis]PVH30536.1 oxidoreductase [Pararhodobacter oceanensis]
MSFSISGKTAIITGAAAGIGHAIARHFLDQGANVVFADQSEKRLKARCDDLENHDNALFFVGDLSEKLNVANLLSATIDAFDRVDILVNAARLFSTTDPLDPTDNSVEQSLNQNLHVALRLSQAVARRMITQAETKEEDDASEAGTIVNLSSLAANRTQPELLAFSISNAALEQMTRSLAVSLAQNNIRVNAIAVGSVMSGSLRDVIADNPDYRDTIKAGTPMQRIGTAKEVAEAAQFLASSASSFVTGQIIGLDGGRSVLDTVQRPAH